MGTLKRILSGVIVIWVLVIGALVIGARFSDGPLGMIAGGPFTTGSLVTDKNADLSYLHDIREVEFQLLDPERSRTTWVIEYEGKAYIPSGYMATWWGKLWKKWPAEAERDGRVLLRVDDKIYERQLLRIQDGPLLGPITTELSRKYADGTEFPAEMVPSGNLWLFELAPR